MSDTCKWLLRLLAAAALFGLALAFFVRRREPEYIEIYPAEESADF